MRTAVLIPACICCAVSGRRARIGSQAPHGLPKLKEQEKPTPCHAFARLLVELNPAIGWQVGSLGCCTSAKRNFRISRSSAESGSAAFGKRAESDADIVVWYPERVRQRSAVPSVRPRFQGASMIAGEIQDLVLPGMSAVLVALLFNLHYILLGRPWREALLTSRPVLSFSNKLSSVLFKQLLLKQGVPTPNRTEAYAYGDRQGQVDVYEPIQNHADLNTLRPAVLYFHSGAFMYGFPGLGSGVCGWLASHGAVCLAASYRLTNSGAGVSGCIEDAWAALRWTRANAARLNINASNIIVVGDSAGGLLATALGTGLDPNSHDPIDRSELPAAVLASWPATALGARTYIPRRAANGTWESTPAAKDFVVPNVFVPAEYADTVEATQERVRTVMTNGLLLFGRRLFGLLPPTNQFPADDAASVSPQRLANRKDLPPMLLLCAESDEVVPCTQTRRFAETAQAAGNEVAQLIFDGAQHGGGAVSCSTGRKAALSFLRHHELLPVAETEEDDPRDCMGGLMRAVNQMPRDYEALDFQAAQHGSSTMHVRPA